MRVDPDLRIDPQRGFRVVRSPAIPLAGEVAEQACRIVGGTAPPKDAYRGHLWEHYLRGVDLDPASPIARFATDPSVVAAVADYLGVVPVLASVEVWRSWYADGLLGSQHLHCDWDDLTQVKVFVYCTDVPAEAGPLTLIDAAASDTARRRLRYSFRGSRERFLLADEVVIDAVDGITPHEITGRSGDVVLADTSRCFHQGSRIRTHGVERVVAIYQYVRPRAFILPIDFRRNATLTHLASSDAEKIDRLVLRAP